MGLADVQKVMARLYIDPEVRNQFFGDPTTVGATLGLAAAETQSLAQVPRCQFEQYGKSLLRKRRDQVRRNLPNTAACWAASSLLFLSATRTKHHLAVRRPIWMTPPASWRRSSAASGRFIQYGSSTSPGMSSPGGVPRGRVIV